MIVFLTYIIFCTVVCLSILTTIYFTDQKLSVLELIQIVLGSYIPVINIIVLCAFLKVFIYDSVTFQSFLKKRVF